MNSFPEVCEREVTSGGDSILPTCVCVSVLLRQVDTARWRDEMSQDRAGTEVKGT